MKRINSTSLSVYAFAGIAILSLLLLFFRDHKRGHVTASNGGSSVVRETLNPESPAITAGNILRPDDSGKQESAVLDSTEKAIPSAVNPVAADGGKLDGVTEEVKAWLTLPFSGKVFAVGVAFLGDRNLSEQMRIVILDKLHSRRRHLAANDIGVLVSEIRRMAGDVAEPVALRARAVSAMATLLVVIQEENILSRADIEACFPFFTELVEDKSEAPAVRGRAVRALGILGADNAGAMSRSILSDPANLDKPELSRNACLALVKAEGELAVEPVGKIMASTTDKNVFGTAAFALGQVHTEDSMVALVQNKDRFPDSGSADAVLAGMEDVILDILREPENPDAVFAVEATRHLWKDGQRERYLPVLRGLSASARFPVKRAAVERLIEDAGSLPLKEEQEELSVILPMVSGNSELAAYTEQIRKRLKARPIFPDAKEIPTAAILSHPIGNGSRSAGNTSAQEYGDAVYRKLNSVSWLGYNYNHAGLYAGQSKGDKRCIEADTLTGDTSKDNSFSDSFTGYGSDYYGAYQLSNKTITFNQRKAVMATANEVADAYIYYTYFSALDPISNDRPIEISNIDNLRCDGVVEYCYEVNGNKSWWQEIYPDRWDISLYPDEHNDAPDATVDPDTEESPWAQRGAPESSSEGPGYGGVNPENACLNKSSVIKYPTYELSYSRVDSNTIDVTVKATDESGIAYIAYRKPGTSTWINTSWQPMQPLTDSYSCDIQITGAGILYYAAEDNGGNLPASATGITFHTLNSSAGSGGSVSPEGTAIVPNGESYTYEASPNVDYFVNKWYLDGTVVQSGGNIYTISDILGDHDVQVTFRDINSTSTGTFSAGPGGSVSGTATQVVKYGGSCSPVTANPDADYTFVNWTGSETTTDNPLTVENVTDDMNFTANFAHDTAQLTMEVSPAESGSTNPSGTITIDTVTETAVSVTPATGYHFVDWTASPSGNVVFGNANLPNTTVVLSGDAAVTANLALNSYTVTFVSGENGSLSGQTVQTADHGASCTPVTAIPDDDYVFSGWTGDYSGISNPLTVSNVAKDMTVTANFAEIPSETDICYGKKYVLDASAAGLANFASVPRVYATYIDPVKGGKPKKTYLNILDKIPKGTGPVFVNCEWKGLVVLFNRKLWDKKLTCEENMVLNGEIQALSTSLFVTGKDLAGKTVKDQDAQIVLNLVPPEITGVYDANEDTVSSAGAGQTLLIKGIFFGTRTPAAWMEYPAYDAKGEVKEIRMLRLKVSRTLRYPDSRKLPGRSCMDIGTGLSEITVSTPSSWPRSWDHGIEHNIVIDNKIGRATIDFRTE